MDEADKHLAETLLSLPSLTGEPVEELIKTLTEDSLACSRQLRLIDLLPDLPATWPPEVGAAGKVTLTRWGG